MYLSLYEAVLARIISWPLYKIRRRI